MCMCPRAIVWCFFASGAGQLKGVLASVTFTHFSFLHIFINNNKKKKAAAAAAGTLASKYSSTYSTTAEVPVPFRFALHPTTPSSPARRLYYQFTTRPAIVDNLSGQWRDRRLAVPPPATSRAPRASSCSPSCPPPFSSPSSSQIGRAHV